MKFEALDSKKHNRKDFDCGISALNIYLQKFANQDQKKSLTKAYVLSEGRKIIGYYTISAHSVEKDTLPETLNSGHYTDLPFLLLGRLAVDREYQGHGYGATLIYHACKTTINTAEKIGIFGIIVEAKNDASVEFYKKLGFKQLKQTKNRLVLPSATIKHIIENAET